jgi:sporulation protein YqfC
MSVVEKIKAVSEVAGEITKEKPRLTFISNNLVTAENYTSLKHFDSNCMLIDFSDYCIKLSGMELIIESFTPGRITLGGKIREMIFVMPGSEDVTQ